MKQIAIKTHTDLPEYGKYVLVNGINKKQYGIRKWHICEMNDLENGVEFKESGFFLWLTENGINIEEVTHWCELPKQETLENVKKTDCAYEIAKLNCLLFANNMLKEIKANSHKGNWEDWNDVNEMLKELQYHFEKLKKAIESDTLHLIKEYLADCGNILMFIGNQYNLYHNNFSEEKSKSLPLHRTSEENCCTPIGQQKRYIDCKGCDKKPSQIELNKESYIHKETINETLEEAMNIHGYFESDYDKIWREGVEFGIKWTSGQLLKDNTIQTLGKNK